jgi:hypothetical protein
MPALLLLAALATGCGHAGDRAPSDEPAPAPDAAPPLDATGALCVAAATGALRARLQGAIEAEIDWGEDTVHCLGGVRPQGDGVRLLYKGSVPNAGPLLVVLGLAPLRPGESARNVPVNLTLVREGTGQFYATQGEDKCALDAVSQVPVEGEPRLFRLEGRGYCTQPARAVGGDGAVLLSRFDVVAIVAAAPEQPSGTRGTADSTP